KGDDGQAIASVRLTRDGKTIVYSRGSETNKEGTSANPTSQTKMPKQQAWAVNVSGGEPRLLGDMGCNEEGREDLQVSPDGKNVVFIRQPGVEFKRPLIPEFRRPWALCIADAQTGESRELFHSGNATEDSLPLFAFKSLKFTNAGRIIFASEKDGRNHLYSIAAEGGAPQLFTPGNFDVEDVVLSADKRSVLYTSNQNDVDRRHIWRVGA